MSLPEYLLSPDEGPPDFMCHLCGDCKPADDLALEARAQYQWAVCTRCWAEVQEA